MTPQNYKDPTPRPVPLWGQRSHRAYLNATEAFAPFAALVLIIHATGQENSTTAFLCMAFFWLRLIHAIVYWLAVPYVRTVVFTLGIYLRGGPFLAGCDINSNRRGAISAGAIFDRTKEIRQHRER